MCPAAAPTSTASFRYDEEGERVAQQTTTSSGGTTTTTRYLLGGLEELSISGATTTLTKYYSVPGVVTAVKVGTTLSYLATDGLGSVSVALAVAGSTTGQALYLPYGAGRYASGSLPTARGYTGQYQDATSGLDYYGARYYDPTLGQFTSADTVLDGLDAYSYVGNNPVTYTDPGGNMKKPPVRDPYLRNIVEAVWRGGAAIGDRSSMAALLQEAQTGQPTMTRYGPTCHYQKVWGAHNGLSNWVQSYFTAFAAAEKIKALTSLGQPTSCTPEEAAATLERLKQHPDLPYVWLMIGYMETAIAAWEASPYHTGIPGKNPFVALQPGAVPAQPGIGPAAPLPSPDGGIPSTPPVAVPPGTIIGSTLRPGRCPRSRGSAASRPCPPLSQVLAPGPPFRSPCCDSSSKWWACSSWALSSAGLPGDHQVGSPGGVAWAVDAEEVQGVAVSCSAQCEPSSKRTRLRHTDTQVKLLAQG